MATIDKKRAEEILMANACCYYANYDNKLCQKCPWCETEDCAKTTINEKLIIEAIDAMLINK